MTPERYTHGHHEAVLRSHRWRTVENSAGHLLPHLRPGLDVLDVGCGPGTITDDLARRVAPGRVVGIDRSEGVVDRAASDSSTPGIEFRVADLMDLPFEDGSFDVVHAHQVLQHLADPVGAADRDASRCRPGGLIAVRDADYQGFTWAPADTRLDRWLDRYRAIARANRGEPDAGRHLLGWLHAAGLTDVTAGASVWCFAEPMDRAWWAQTWAERMTTSVIADQLVDEGLCSEGDLSEIAAAFLAWADHPDAWFAVLHGEAVARA